MDAGRMQVWLLLAHVGEPRQLLKLSGTEGGCTQTSQRGGLVPGVGEFIGRHPAAAPGEASLARRA